MLYSFFWMIPRPLNFMCRRFGSLCQFHLHRRRLPMNMKLKGCSETSAHKIQTPGNHPKERIQHSEHSESLKPYSTFAIKFTIHFAFLCKQKGRTQLNIQICLSRLHDIFRFTIYRKPTFTDLIVPYDSCHPPEHKYTAMRYMLNRLNTYQTKHFGILQEQIIIQIILHYHGLSAV